MLNDSKTLINCRGKLIDLSTPKVMGIINLTPDSFFAGSRKQAQSEVVQTAEHMLDEGADFLDLGAYSSRPGAEHISSSEELNRIEVIKELIREFPNAVLSIDTFRSSVAKKAVDYGASIINDISAGNLDDEMFNTVADLRVPYIMMHMQGTPQNMKSLTTYDNILHDMGKYFSEKVNHLVQLGANDIIIDPGFGFAKTIEQNFYVLKHLSYFKHLKLPILAGISRKSMIWKTLESHADHALNGTTVLNTLALNNGANILRVHDVKEAKECIRLQQAYEGGNP